jgi:hypothetical protein
MPEKKIHHALQKKTAGMSLTEKSAYLKAHNAKKKEKIASSIKKQSKFD